MRCDDEDDDDDDDEGAEEEADDALLVLWVRALSGRASCVTFLGNNIDRHHGIPLQLHPSSNNAVRRRIDDAAYEKCQRWTRRLVVVIRLAIR